MKVLVAQLCLTLCDPMDHQAPLSMEFSRQEYWSGLHSLLQGFFPAQGSNPGLLHFGQILYHLSHQISYIIYVLYYDVISSLLLLGEPTVPKSVSYRVGS